MSAHMVHMASWSGVRRNVECRVSQTLLPEGLAAFENPPLQCHPLALLGCPVCVRTCVALEESQSIPTTRHLSAMLRPGFEGPTVICRHDGTRLTVNDLSRMLEFCEKLSRKCVSLEDLEGENPHTLWAECRGWRITGGPRLSSSEAVTQEIFHTEPAKEVQFIADEECADARWMSSLQAPSTPAPAVAAVLYVQPAPKPFGCRPQEVGAGEAANCSPA